MKFRIENVGNARDFVRLGFTIQAIKQRFTYWVLGDVQFIRASQFDTFI